MEVEGNTSDKVLSLLKQDNTLTIAELSTKLSVTIITIKRILNGLQNTNRVKREGNNRTGKWILVDE